MQYCKPGVKIINVARGGIVDEAALLVALESGRCGGAGIDVFTSEPPTDLSLCRHPKVVCTPHLGASTIEAQERVALEIAEQIVTGNAGGPLTGLVNAQALAACGTPAALPWLTLATSLGQVASAVLAPSKSTTVTIQCYGDDVSPLARAVGPAVVVGILKAAGHSSANLVNFATLASDNNITFQNSTSSERPSLLATAITQCLLVTVTTSAGSTSVMGSVSNGRAVLYAIQDCMWESGLPLSCTLLLFRASSGSPDTTLLGLGTAVAGKGGRLLSLVSSGQGSSEQYYAIRMTGDVIIPEAPAGAEFLAKLIFS
uniref:D-3-phosphoglycerate dehydrogenase-like n=2 Tax=Hirondellea gigas TaxID=1518452 RepID=A0A6A7FPY2_9CRUS